MSGFSSRSYKPELMDTQKFSFREYSHYLEDLEYINRLTLLYGPTLQWIKKQYPEDSAKPLKILDVASGRGDMTRRIWNDAKKHYFNVSVIGIDINPHATRAAQNIKPEGAGMRFQTCDIFSYNPKEKPDYILSIQFTHHLKDEDLIDFIRWLDKYAERGWFIHDLHRHPVPYYFIKFILHLLPVHPAMKNDGPLSVAKAFTKKDWIWFLQKSEIEMGHVDIKWHFPFRYSIACTKPQQKKEINGAF